MLLAAQRMDNMNLRWRHNCKKIVKLLIIELFKLIGIRILSGSTNEPTRHEWIRRKLSELPKGATILDAGAGECFYKKYCKHLNYIAQDFCEYKGNELILNTTTPEWNTSRIDIVADICDIPMKDNSVDIVLCSEVLEHVPDPVAALKSIMRLVRPGGYLIVTAPFMSRSHQEPYHFATGFSRFFYQKHLGEGNFNILELEANGNAFKYLAQELFAYPFFAQYRSKISLRRVLDTVACLFMRWRLAVGNKYDRNTKDNLCFGYHLLGQKREAISD